MAPKKEKKDQVTGDKATDKVLDYLRKQNRPYSITELVANLHNSVSKTVATKVLRELVDSGSVIERTSGKAVVYHIAQDPKDTASPEELKAFEEELEILTKSNAALKRKLKELEGSIASIRSAPSPEVLEAELDALNEKNTYYEKQIKVLESGNIEMASAEELAEAEAAFKKARADMMKRKKCFKELWAYLCDNTDEDSKKLWERLGLE